MTLFPLPKYRSLEACALGARLPISKPWLTERATHIIQDLAVLLAIFALLQGYVQALTTMLERPLVTQQSWK